MNYFLWSILIIIVLLVVRIIFASYIGYNRSKNWPQEIRKVMFKNFYTTEQSKLTSKNLLIIYQLAINENALAQFEIGILYANNGLYENEFSIGQDFARKAIYWLEKAAENNLLQAQIEVGYKYLTEPFLFDEIKGLKWLQTAELNGSDYATKLILKYKTGKISEFN